MVINDPLLREDAQGEKGDNTQKEEKSQGTGKELPSKGIKEES